VIAAIRYQAALLAHSQRYLPPLVLFLGLLAIQYTDPTAPALPEFAVSAGALLVVACWLTIALVDVESPVQRLVTRSHVRRVPAVVASLAFTVLPVCVLLAVVSEIWALLVHASMPAAELGYGLLAHLACALTGTAVGLPCSRLLVGRFGYTVVSALAVVAVVLLARPVPLVNPMLRTLAGGGSVTGSVLLSTGLGALALAVSIAVVSAVAVRRS
jgi:hypothetical protein